MNLKRQAQDITKLQKEIETMKSSLNELEQSSKQKDEVIANLSKALEKQREKTDLVKVMMDWKQKKMEASREVTFQMIIFIIEVFLS